ncbi:hypothetical protein [Rossellomorea marisflavi]|uniref:hypothetical protein n=1 Tax=Rossellomorea marisflavi TaxID=189381 RepID=UPI00345A48C2
MKTRLILSGVMSLVVILSGCGTDGSSKEKPKDDAEETVVPEAEKGVEHLDMIANDEQIIKTLKESGKIPENATKEDIEKALQDYIKDKNADTLKNEKEKQKYIEELKEKIKNEQ